MSKQSNINAFVKFVQSSDLALQERSVNSQVDYELSRIISGLENRYNAKEEYKSEIMSKAQAMMSNRDGDIEGAEAYDPDKILQYERQYTWADEQQGACEVLLKHFKQAQEQLFPEAKDKAEKTAEALARAEARFA